ncbi:phage tail tip lysozyme [Leptothoe sp. EHU-05/26/07-4]
MSTTIGSLIAELGIDDSKFKANLKMAQAEGIKAAREVEKAFGKSLSRGDLRLTPEVDDRQLTSLNAHLTLKEKHFGKARNDMKRDPLKPSVDLEQLDQLEAKLTNITQLQKAAQNQVIQASVETTGSGSSAQMSQAVTQFSESTKTFDAAVKQAAGGGQERLFYDSRSGRYRYAEGPREGRIVRDRDLAQLRPADSPYVRQGQRRVQISADKRDARTFRELFATEADELADVIEGSVEKGVQDGIYGGAVRKAFRGLGFLFGSVVEGALGQLGSFAFSTILEKGFGIEETIKIDASQIDAVTQALVGTDEKVESIVASIETSISGLGDRLAIEIEEGVRKGMEPSKFEKLLNFATGGLFGAFGDIMQGLYEEIGAGFGAEISAGLVRSFESNFEVSLQQFGNNKGERLFPLLKEGYRRTEGAQIAVEDTAKLLGDRVRLAGFRLGDGLVAALDEPQLRNKLAALVTGIDFSGWNEAIEDIGEQLSDIATNFNDTMFAGMSEIKVLDEAIRSNRQFGVQERAVPLARERALEIVQSGKRRNTANIVDENTRELFITTGGYAKARGLSGKRISSDLDKQAKEAGQAEERKAIWVRNEATDIRETDSAIGKLYELMKSLSKPHLQGYSPDAVEMAAQAYAALMKNSEITVKLLGESGGGFAAEEAHEIMKQLGFGDRVQYMGVGTPDLIGRLDQTRQNKIISPDEMLGREAHMYARMGLANVDSPTQNILGVKGHPYEHYRDANIAQYMDFTQGNLPGVDKEGAQSILNAAKQFQAQDLGQLDSRQLETFAAQAMANLQMVRRNLAVATDDVREELEEAAVIFNDIYLDAAPDDVGGMGNMRAAIGRAKEIRQQILENPGAESVVLADQVYKELKKYKKEFDELYKNTTGTVRAKYERLSGELDTLLQDFGAPDAGIRPRQKVEMPLKAVQEPVLEQVPPTHVEESLSAIATEAQSIGREIGLAVKEVVEAIELKPVELKLPEPLQAGQLAEPTQLVREMESRIQGAQSLVNADPNQAQNILQGVVDEFSALETQLRDLLKLVPSGDRMSSEVANQLTNLLSRVQRIETVQERLLASLSNTNRPPPGDALRSLRQTFTDQTRLLNDAQTPQEQRVAAARGILSRGAGVKDRLTELRGAAPDSVKKEISSAKGQVTRAQKEAARFLESVGEDASQAGAELGEGLVTGIDQSMANVEDSIRGLVEGVKDATEEGFEISSPSKLFKRYGRFLPLGLVEGIKSVDITESANNLISQLDPIVDKAKQTYQELKDSGELRNKVQEGTVNAVGYVGGVAGGAIGGVPGSLIGDSGGALLARKVSNDLLAVYDAIAEGNAKGILAILKRAREIKLEPENIAEANRTYREDLTGFSIGNVVGNLSPLPIPLQGAMAAMYSTSDIVDMIDQVKAGEGVRGALKQGGKKLATKPIGGIKQLFSMIERAVSSEDLESVSEEVVNGIAQGLEDTGIAQDQARSLAQDIVQATKDELQINSPSEVFEEIARMCLAGFEKGLSEFRASKAGSEVEAQLSQWVDQLKQTALQKGEELEVAVKELVAKGQTEATDLVSQASVMAQQFGSDASSVGAEEARSLSTKLKNLESGAFNAPGTGGEWEEAVRQQVARASQVLDELADNAEAVSQKLSQELPESADAFEEVAESVGPLEGALNRLKGVGLAALKLFIGFQALTFLSEFMMQFGAASLTAAINFEKLTTSLSFVLGSAAEASDAIQELRDEAQDLGIDANSNIQGFQEIAASTRGTSLEGVATEQIATAASQATSAFLLNPQEAEQVTRALSQISSKGVVSTEEIRQQMGEVLPSAFQTAARSMGVTTSELDRMLARGEVLSTEFLPKFAQQLSAETAAGVAGASKTAQASLNRLTNQIEELKIAFGEQLLPVQKLGADVLGAALSQLVEIFPTLINLVTTVGAVFAVRFAISAGLAAKAVRGLTVNFVEALVAAKGLTFEKVTTGLKGMFGALAKTTAAMLTFGLQMLAIQAAIAAVRLAWQFFGDSSGDLGDFAEASTRGVDNLIAKLQQLQEETGRTNEALNGMGNRSQRDQLNSVKVQGFAGELLDNDLIQRISDISGRVNPVDRLSRVIPGIGEEGMMGVYQRTFAADQLSDQSARIAEMGAEQQRLSEIAASYLDGGANADRTDEYIRVQEQLKAIQQQESALRILDPADVEALEKVTAAKDELLSRQGPLVEEIEGVRATINARIQITKNAMSDLEGSLTSGAISPEEFAVGMADYEAQLADAVADQEAFNDALDGTASRLSELNLEFEMIAARIADASQAASRSVMGDRQRLLQAQLAGNASSGQVAFTAGLIDQKRLKEELRILENELSDIEIQLEAPEMKGLIDNLRLREPGIDQMGTNQLNVIRERFAENPEYQQAIDRLAEAQNVRLQTDELSVQIAEARLEANQQIKDANREITEYYREVSNQANELALQTREVASQADFAGIKNKLKSAMTGMSGSFFDDWIGGFMNFLDSLQEIVQIQIDANRQRMALEQQQMQAQMQAQQLQRGLPGQVPGVVGGSGGFASPLAGQSIQSLIDYAPSKEIGQDFHASRDGGRRIHRGIDIDSRAGGGLGAQVLASLGGTAQVIDIGEQSGDIANSVGVWIESQLGNGIPIEIRYNHLNLDDVRRDLGVGIGGTAQVNAGQALGTVVNHHLDYKVLVNGEHVDPQEFMAAMVSGGGIASTVDGRSIQIVANAPVPTSPQMPTSTVAGSSATVDQNQGGLDQQAFNFFRTKGASELGAAMLVGNIQQESGFDPSAVGDDGAAHGIFQWHPDRRDASFPVNDFIGQLEYAWNEFAGPNGSAIRGIDFQSAIASNDRGTVQNAIEGAIRWGHEGDRWQYGEQALQRFGGSPVQPVGVNTGQFNQAQGLQNQNFAMDIDLIERRAAIAVEQANLEANNLFKQLMGTANRESMAVEDRRTGIDRELQDRTIQSIPQGDLQSRTQEAVATARSAADSSTQYQRDIQQLTADIESANEALATMEQARGVLAGQLDTPGLSQQLANYDALIERTRTLRDERESLLNDTQEAFSGALDFEYDSAMATFERQAEDANIAAGNVDPIEAQTADLRRQITALEDHMETASSTYRESIEGLYPEEQVDELVEAFNLPNQIKLDGAVREVERLEESLLAAQEAARVEIRTEGLAELTRILNRSGQGNQAQELNFQNQRDQLDAEENNRISAIRNDDSITPAAQDERIAEVRTLFERRRENLAFDQEMNAGERDRTMRQQSLGARQGLQGARQQRADMLGFGGVAPLRQEEMNLALEQQQIDYEAQIAELYATTDAAGRTTEAFAEMEAAIEATNQLSIENIKTQFSELPELIGAIKQPMTDALSSWIQGTKSFDEAFSDMLSSILSNLISMMANKAIEGLLGSLLGGMGGSGGGETGGIAGTGGGGGILGIVGSVFGGLFKDGGKVGRDGSLVPNFSLGGPLHGGDPIKDALKREGPGARVIVANDTEWILNRKHQEILRQYGVNEQVLGFRDGGPVGKQSFSPAVRGAAAGGSSEGITVNIPITVNGSGGEDDGRELARRLADPIKALVASEVSRMRKPGGPLRSRK